MKPVGHPLGIGQQTLAGVVERLPQVYAVAVDLVALLGRQAFQAGPSGRFIPPRLDRQHTRPLRIRQVGQHGHVQLVTLFQTNLIHAEIANYPLRIDRFDILQLVLDDTADRLGRDA